jgi:uncharacterized membrane protein YbaN (DUF454 family)
MTEKADTIHHEDPMPGKRAQLGYLVLAYLATAFGIAGVFLPLLPTTPFLLVAVWAASRGSPRVHDWIYSQPQFARLINNWHEQGAVPLGAKWLATAMMITSWSFLLWFDYHWGLLLGMSLFFLCIGAFLWTRPNPGPWSNSKVGSCCEVHQTTRVKR